MSGVPKWNLWNLWNLRTNFFVVTEISANQLRHFGDFLGVGGVWTSYFFQFSKNHDFAFIFSNFTIYMLSFLQTGFHFNGAGFHT